MTIQRLKTLAAVCAMAFMVARGGGDDELAATAPAPKNIVQVAQGNADLSILVDAVVAAKLVSTLQAAGLFTLFAPTEAAFAALISSPFHPSLNHPGAIP